MKKTVTIGITAYNEEKNIENILLSVLKQKRRTFKLDKVLVVSDGSKDWTVEIAQALAKKHPEITVVDEKNRLGKATRLNEIYKLNQSDFIITFDADLVLAESDVIEQMLKPFDDNRVGVTAANSIPLPSNTFEQKIILTWHDLWYEIRTAYRNGHIIQNLHGCATAIRASLARKVSYPKKITGDQDYLYFCNQKAGLKFYFCKNAHVIIRFPENFQELAQLMTRTNNEKNFMIGEFGKQISSAYQIPCLLKIRETLKMFVKKPILLTLAFFYNFRVLLYEKTCQKNSSALWTINTSTKKMIVFP